EEVVVVEPLHGATLHASAASRRQQPRGDRFEKIEGLARNYLLAPYAARSYVTGDPDAHGRLATRQRSVGAPVAPRRRSRAEGGGMIMRSIRGAIRSGALLLGVAATTFSPAQARRAPAAIAHRSTGS